MRQDKYKTIVTDVGIVAGSCHRLQTNGAMYRFQSYTNQRATMTEHLFGNYKDRSILFTAEQFKAYHGIAFNTNNGTAVRDTINKINQDLNNGLITWALERVRA